MGALYAGECPTEGVLVTSQKVFLRQELKNGRVREGSVRSRGAPCFHNTKVCVFFLSEA